MLSVLRQVRLEKTSGDLQPNVLLTNESALGAHQVTQGFGWLAFENLPRWRLLYKLFQHFWHAENFLEIHSKLRPVASCPPALQEAWVCLLDDLSDTGSSLLGPPNLFFLSLNKPIALGPQLLFGKRQLKECPVALECRECVLGSSDGRFQAYGSWHGDRVPPRRSFLPTAIAHFCGSLQISPVQLPALSLALLLLCPAHFQKQMERRAAAGAL